MFENILLPFKLWSEKKKFELHSTKLAFTQLEEALKLSEVNTLAKGDADDAQWNLLSSSGIGEGGLSTALTPEKLSTSREQSRKFYRYNPHSRAIIRSLCKFVIGRGVSFAAKFESESITKEYQKQCRLFWEEFVRREHFLDKQKEFIRRYTRDGEVFIRFYKDKNGVTRIRFMEPDRVATPSTFVNGMINGRKVRGNLSYGIETARNDIEKVFFYYYLTGDVGDMTSFVRVPAKDVIHVKLSADSNCKRGFPYLEPVLREAKTYNDWLQDRVILNKIRTAVALVRKIPPTGGPQDKIKSIRDGNKAQGQAWDTQKMQLLKPGTILTARGVEYEFLSPNLDAKDSAQDGRNILLAMAAGSGLPEYMVTGDASNANYSSSMVAESPGVREFEDLQDDLRTPFQEIYYRVMMAAVIAKALKGPIPRADLVFPSLISRDIKREADANVAYHQDKVLSLKTVRGRIGANNEVENENLQSEMDIDYLQSKEPTVPKKTADPNNNEERIEVLEKKLDKVK